MKRPACALCTPRVLPLLVLLLAVGIGRALPSHADSFEDALLPLIEAHRSGKPEALRSAVANFRGDPWFAVDDLVAAGHREAALAFAAAIKLPDGDALRQYAKSSRATDPEVRARLHRAQALLRAKEYRKALDELEDVEAGKGTVFEARRAYTRGIAYFRLGAPGSALEVCTEAARIAQSLGWLQMEYFARKSAANMARAHRAWAAQTDALERLAELLDAMGEPVRAAKVRADLAGHLVYQGDMSRVTGLHGQAHAALSKAGLHGDAAIVAVNASLVLARRGERAKATEWLEIAEGHLEHGVDPEEVMRVTLLRAALRREIGEYAAAIDDLEAWLESRPDADAHARAAVLAQMALAHLQMEDPEDALRRFDEAIEVLRPGGDATAIGNIERRKAAALLAHGHGEKAAALLEKALPALAGDPLGQALARLQLARVLLVRKNALQALVAAEHAASDLDRLGARDFQSDAERVLAEVSTMLGRHGDTIQHARRSLEHLDRFVAGLSDESMAKARARGRRVFEIGLGTGLDAKKPEWSVAMLERWRAHALLDALGGRVRLRGVGLSAALRAQERDAEAALTMARREFAAKRGASRWAEVRASAEVVRSAEIALREVIRRTQRAAKRVTQLKYPEPADIGRIQKALRKNEVLVYITRRDEDVVAVLVDPSGASQSRIASAEKAAEALAAFESAALDPDEPADAPLRSLRALLGKTLPLPKGTATVYVCPDGDLCYVPWPALLPAHEVACVPSGTVLAALRADSAPRGEGVLALGGPDYMGRESGRGPMSYGGRPLMELPGSAAEVHAIATGKKDRAFVGAAASEATLERALASKVRWRALLLSCHGLVHRVHPSLTALALTADDVDDGFLSIYEILDMEFNTDLVVASACDSGRGPVVRGEGVLGLARAFMVGGAPRVIVSLWKADDEATRELMVRFFRHWRAGAGTAAALRAAQGEMQTQSTRKEWRHPYYWAGWVPWGLGD